MGRRKVQGPCVVCGAKVRYPFREGKKYFCSSRCAATLATKLLDDADTEYLSDEDCYSASDQSLSVMELLMEYQMDRSVLETPDED